MKRQGKTWAIQWFLLMTLVVLVLFFVGLYVLWTPSFVEAFWPGLFSGAAATAIGAALGLPVGLWLNRRTQDLERRSKHEMEDRWLADALIALKSALSENLLFLSSLEVVVSNPEKYDPVIMDVHINNGTWEAVRGEISPFLHEPQLQASIADHFSMLAELAGLLDIFRDLRMGVPSTLQNSNQRSIQVLGLIQLKERHCTAQARDILARIDKIIPTLKPAGGEEDSSH